MVKNNSSSRYKNIPHSVSVGAQGVLFTIEFDDIRESAGTVVYLKVDAVYVPAGSYSNITNTSEIVIKHEELDDNVSKKFVKDLNEKAKKLSKASLPATRKSVLPRFN